MGRNWIPRTLPMNPPSWKGHTPVLSLLSYFTPRCYHALLGTLETGFLGGRRSFYSAFHYVSSFNRTDAEISELKSSVKVPDPI